MKETLLERYKKQLERYLEAEESVLTGQSYTIGSRTLTRADLSVIANRIDYLEKRIISLESNGKRKVVRVIPRDL